jgi:L-threonylcarbamoyladenylate synthase
MRVLRLKQSKPKEIIRITTQALAQQQLVVYPTETCYGLGADATSAKAVKKILQFKGKRLGKPILVAVADKEMAKKYVALNQTAQNLYRHFLPGPVAIVSHSKGKVAPGVASLQQTLGIRIPNYPLILRIINSFGKPITSTSANPAGKKPPYCLKDFLKYTSLKKQQLVSLFLDAGQLPLNPPSTVVDTTLQEPAVLRQGEIMIDEIPGQVFISNSEKATQKIGAQIFNSFQNILPVQPLIFALQGELGSGKTQLAKGLGQALGIKSNIPSPTFIYVREYPFRLADSRGIFYHIDTWRMQAAQDLEALGLNKMLKPGNLIAIEWLQKVRPLLEKISRQKKALVIWFTLETLSPNKRKIKYQT